MNLALLGVGTGTSGKKGEDERLTAHKMICLINEQRAPCFCRELPTCCSDFECLLCSGFERQPPVYNLSKSKQPENRYCTDDAVLHLRESQTKVGNSREA